MRKYHYFLKNSNSLSKKVISAWYVDNWYIKISFHGGDFKNGFFEKLKTWNAF